MRVIGKGEKSSELQVIKATGVGTVFLTEHSSVKSNVEG